MEGKMMQGFLRKIAVASGAATLIATWAPPAAIAQVVGPNSLTAGNCGPGKMAYQSESSPFFDFKDGYAVIKDSNIEFTQGGVVPSCVVVRFSGDVNIPSGALKLRAVLDGKTVAQPGAVVLQDGDSGVVGARGFIFVFPKVAPGNHTMSMQVYKPISALAVAVYAYTATLIHQ
jgi:hypothetical protein